MIRIRFWALILLWLILFLAQQIITSSLLSFALVFLVLLPLASLLALLWTRSKLGLALGREQYAVERGEEATWLLKIDNFFLTRAVFLQLKIKENSLHHGQKTVLADFIVEANSSRTLKLTSKTHHCGQSKLGNLNLYMRDSFGFFMVKIYNNKTSKRRFITGTSRETLEFPEILVLPKLESLSARQDKLAEMFEAGQLPSSKSNELLDEIDRYRPLAEGDSLKLINWKISARLQQWMVKQYEQADDKSIFFLLILPTLYFNSYNQESEKLLTLRDQILDFARKEMTCFVSEKVRVNLLTRQPEVILQQAENLDELDLVNQQLAQIPYQLDLSFKDQLQEAGKWTKNNLLSILSYTVNKEMVEQLKILKKLVRGLHFDLMLGDKMDQNEEVIACLQDLTEAGISNQISLLTEGE